ncbi:protein kinase [Micromonospora sp. NBC_00389]|uniref:serine/threonine-protein kinase n=1 Tax=Micromonospora sp. NBC_00389 TaxID=2903586 RepID=UPI002E23A406
MLRRVLGGRYQPERLLGSGGMAAVWHGRDLRLDRPVAIKVLAGAGLTEPMALERFDREARSAARLAHPNVVGVYDFGTDDGDPYLVMELVEGRSVSALLAEGPLPLAQALTIAVQTCDGLSAAHTAGVIHRDIKPGNLILTPTGVVKICDFGIARLPHAGQNTLTGAATVLGTTAYMAPEQASAAPLDARADLYALGCTVYALLAGAPPFTGDPLSVLHQHRNQPPTPLSARRDGIPLDLDALAAELLAKKPADRPSDARQVRVRFAALLGTPDLGASAVTVPGLPGAAGPVTMPNMAVVAAGGPPAGVPDVSRADRAAPPAKQRRRRGPAGMAAAVVAAVLLAVAAIAWLNSDRSRPAAQAVATPTPSAPLVEPAVVVVPTTAAPTTKAPRTRASTSDQVAPSPTSTSPRPTTTTTPTDPIVAMRLAIQHQVQTGQLNPDAAKDLHSKVDAIARQIAEGDTGRAQEESKKLRDKLDDLYKGGKLTKPGHETLTGHVDRIDARLV